MSIVIDIRHRLGAFQLDAAFSMIGGVSALFGPSGSGKSSIIRAIAGLSRPDAGRIMMNGKILFDREEGIFVPSVDRNIGLVFQDARLFPHMSVRDNLLFGWRRSKARAVQTQIDHVIALLNLETLLERQPKNLSGGEKSRVGLGRALLRSPEVLLLDEPLAALDQKRRDEILPYLERLAREASLPMLYVSHTVEDVARLADQIVLLDQGKVRRQGSVFDLLPELAQDSGGPSAVLDARVAENSAAEGLSILVFDGGKLTVRHTGLPPDTRMRVRIKSEDILLALEKPPAISANNILPVTISAIRFPNDTDADIQLGAGAARLVARITRSSARRLRLAPGQNIFAVVKTVQFERQSAPVLPAP